MSDSTRQDEAGPPRADGGWADADVPGEAHGWAEDRTWTDEDGWTEDGWDDDGEGWDDDGDYVYVPEEPSLFRRAATVGIVLVVLLFVAIGAGGLWIRGKLDPSGPKEAVPFSIPQEATTAQIASSLEDEGIISDATIFRYYVRFRDAGPFQAGAYEGLTTNQSMGAVIDALEGGPLPPSTSQVVVPEGLWIVDIKAQLLEEFPEMSPEDLDAALATLRSRYMPDVPREGTIQPLEGLLFPAGYEVLDADRGDEAKLLQQMIDAFDRTADELDVAGAPGRLAPFLGEAELTPYDVIVVASLIEEEAGTSADKPRIARVIYNRMLRGMRLEIDATVNYAIQDHKETLTQSDLAVDSPFNTRRFSGLPPTPIAAPGRESLEAALNPSEEDGAGSWLYYVLADAEGNHFFTGDYDEFLRVGQESRDAGLFE